MKTQNEHWRKKSYQKVTLETKLLVVDQILNGQVSTRFASEKYDVPRTTITYWLRKYSTLVQQNTGMSKLDEIKKLKERIEELEFVNNQLTSLDLSQNTNVFRINCENNQLTLLDLKNGNTNGIARLMAFGNLNLSCIQVDDVVYANSQICDGSNDGNWCKDETAIYSVDCNLGIGDVVLNEAISLFPNPVKNKLQISIQNNIAVKQVVIYNILGKRVLVSDALQLDVSRLASGLFFVHIITNEGSLVKKVIKE